MVIMLMTTILAGESRDGERESGLTFQHQNNRKFLLCKAFFETILKKTNYKSRKAKVTNYTLDVHSWIWW